MNLFDKAIDFFSAQPPSSVVIFEPSSEVGMMLYSALAGAVLGAVVGGLIQAGLSWIEYRRTVKREAEELRERERAIAFRALVVSTQFNNRLFSIVCSMVEQLEEAKGIYGLKGPVLWQRFYPLSGVNPEKLHFATEDVALILKLKEKRLANDMLWLAERYASTLAAVIDFHQKRADLKNVMHMAVQERRAVTIITPDEYAALSPYFQELTDLAEQCCDGLLEEFVFARSVDNRLRTAIDSYFGNEPEMVDVSAETHVTNTIARFKDLVAEVRLIAGLGFSIAEPTQRMKFWVPSYGAPSLQVGSYVFGSHNNLD